ncbi:MAG: DUF4238 domain-containing protein [Nitrospirota bacterium]|nr:DUF4238 domain-containing protein [Nitrospirota bacterium]
MTSTQTKKRHHQIPEFYLKRFAAPDTGQVWNYDKQKGQAWPASVDSTAVESHLYSLTGEDGLHHTEIEDAISSIEGIGAPLLERIIAGDELLGQERYNFASFVAIMFVRTNAFRRLYAELHGNMKMMNDYLVASNDEVFESQMERFQADCGEITDDQKQKLRATMLDPSDRIFLVDREYTLKALEYHDQLAPLLASMQWAIMDAPKGGRRFITSDNPVVHWVPPQYHHGFYGTGGVRNKHVEVLFPLSPDHCWVGHWSQELPGHYETTAEWVKQTNRILAGSAERFLYSHIQSSGILSLAKKYATNQPIIQVGGPGPSKKAEIKVVRTLFRKGK